MSRIQNILEKAEREGAALRTSRMVPPAPAATAAPPPAPIAASVPLTIDIPTPPAADGSAVIVPGGPAAAHTAHVTVPVAQPAPDAIMHCTVRLNPLLVAGLSPKSLAAEQYRQLRTRLAHAEGAQNLRTVLVTSPQKSEGKSITSANLALTMAQDFNHNVVLVEADLRRPTIAGLCGLTPESGLVDVLVGAAALEEVIVQLPDHHLAVLPAGQTTGRSTELLGSTTMVRLIETLRNRFDRIVIDSPPVTLADTHVLARLADGILIVVRSGVTSRVALEHALEGVERDRIAGLVLNDVDLSVGSYAGAYGWTAGA